MEEKDSTPSLRQLVRDQFEGARHLTEWTNPMDSNYTILNSSPAQYDSELWGESGGLVQTVQRLFEEKGQEGTKAPPRQVDVLDFGCGMNRALRELFLEAPVGTVSVTGASVGDPRTIEQRHADERQGFRFINLRSPVQDLGRAKYDLIVSMTTFIHLMDPLQTLKRLYRALRVGGELRVGCSKMLLVDMFMPKISPTISLEEKKKMLELARRYVETFISRVRTSGISIEFTNNDRVLVLRKQTDKPLSLPFVGYQKDRSMHEGLYVLKEPR